MVNKRSFNKLWGYFFLKSFISLWNDWPSSFLLFIIYWSFMNSWYYFASFANSWSCDFSVSRDFIFTSFCSKVCLYFWSYDCCCLSGLALSKLLAFYLESEEFSFLNLVFYSFRVLKSLVRALFLFWTFSNCWRFLLFYYFSFIIVNKSEVTWLIRLLTSVYSLSKRLFCFLFQLPSLKAETTLLRYFVKVIYFASSFFLSTTCSSCLLQIFRVISMMLLKWR